MREPTLKSILFSGKSASFQHEKLAVTTLVVATVLRSCQEAMGSRQSAGPGGPGTRWMGWGKRPGPGPRAGGPGWAWGAGRACCSSGPGCASGGAGSSPPGLSEARGTPPRRTFRTGCDRGFRLVCFDIILHLNRCVSTMMCCKSTHRL